MSGPQDEGGWDDVAGEDPGKAAGDDAPGDATATVATDRACAPAPADRPPSAAGVPEDEPERPDVVAEALRVAEEACKEITRCAGFDVRVLAVAGDPVRIELQGPDAGRIIGRYGATLQALQYLVARIVGNRVSRRVRVKVDVEGYRVRRENALRGLAQRAADRAVRERRTIELDPMNPEERRVVHLALADDGDVRTESLGDGDDRRVCIVPIEDEADGNTGGRDDDGGIDDEGGPPDPGASSDAGT